MSLFNALFSTALFKASQDKFNRDKKKAQQTAYDNVGKKMRRAKKNNQYIDGSREYHKEHRKEIKKAKDKKDVRDHFINKL